MVAEKVTIPPAVADLEAGCEVITGEIVPAGGVSGM